jgi:hypothetical protein
MPICVMDGRSAGEQRAFRLKAEGHAHRNRLSHQETPE